MSVVKGFASSKWAESVADNIDRGIDPEGSLYKLGELRNVRFDDYISALPVGTCITKDAVSMLIRRALRNR